VLGRRILTRKIIVPVVTGDPTRISCIVTPAIVIPPAHVIGKTGRTIEPSVIVLIEIKSAEPGIDKTVSRIPTT